MFRGQKFQKNCILGYTVKSLIFNICLNSVETVLHLEQCFENARIDP